MRGGESWREEITMTLYLWLELYVIDLQCQEVPVHLMNVSDEPKLLRKGVIIAECEELDCVKRTSSKV